MNANESNALVAEVGIVPFHKPGKCAFYDELGAEAIRLAPADAGLDYCNIQQADADYVSGASCSGQRVLFNVGMTGMPAINVNTNCSTGSKALYFARQAVATGSVGCALAAGLNR